MRNAPFRFLSVFALLMVFSAAVAEEAARPKPFKIVPAFVEGETFTVETAKYRGRLQGGSHVGGIVMRWDSEVHVAKVTDEHIELHWSRGPTKVDNRISLPPSIRNMLTFWVGTKLVLNLTPDGLIKELVNHEEIGKKLATSIDAKRQRMINSGEDPVAVEKSIAAMKRMLQSPEVITDAAISEIGGFFTANGCVLAFGAVSESESGINNPLGGDVIPMKQIWSVGRSSEHLLIIECESVIDPGAIANSLGKAVGEFSDTEDANAKLTELRKHFNVLINTEVRFDSVRRVTTYASTTKLVTLRGENTVQTLEWTRKD